MVSDDDFGPDHVPLPGEIMPGSQAPAPVEASERIPPTMGNPFAGSIDHRTHAGAVAIESQRATAEVQGRMVIAKRFPRDPIDAYSRAMQACQRLGLAKVALYSFTRGSRVEGPSIRLAEELARNWGNIEFGLNELSRSPGTLTTPGFSEMEAFAWDLETNAKSSQRFTVPHLRDRSEEKGGAAILTSERDIYEITANMGARRTRARILAILPPELIDDAVEVCKKTVKRGLSNKATFQEALSKLAFELANVGVNSRMLTDFLKHPLAESTPDEYVLLNGILQQINEGSRVSEFFGNNADGGSRLDTLERAVRGRRAAPPAKAQGEPPPADRSAAEPPRARQDAAPAPQAQPQTSAAPPPQQTQAPSAFVIPEDEMQLLSLVRRLIKRVRAAKTTQELTETVSDPTMKEARDWLEKNRQHLNAEISDAIDNAAASLSRLV